jgi:uncharacterized protein YceH (UPF0502 family)
MNSAVAAEEKKNDDDVEAASQAAFQQQQRSSRIKTKHYMREPSRSRLSRLQERWQQQNELSATLSSVPEASHRTRSIIIVCFQF